MAFENPPPDHDILRQLEETTEKRSRRRGLGPKPTDPTARRAWYAERGKRNRRTAAIGTLALVVGAVAWNVASLFARDSSRRESFPGPPRPAIEMRSVVSVSTRSVPGGLELTATFSAESPAPEGKVVHRRLPWPVPGSWRDEPAWEEARAALEERFAAESATGVSWWEDPDRPLSAEARAAVEALVEAARRAVPHRSR